MPVKRSAGRGGRVRGEVSGEGGKGEGRGERGGGGRVRGEVSDEALSSFLCSPTFPVAPSSTKGPVPKLT